MIKVKSNVNTKVLVKDTIYYATYWNSMKIWIRDIGEQPLSNFRLINGERITTYFPYITTQEITSGSIVKCVTNSYRKIYKNLIYKIEHAFASNDHMSEFIDTCNLVGFEGDFSISNFILLDASELRNKSIDSILDNGGVFITDYNELQKKKIIAREIIKLSIDVKRREPVIDRFKRKQRYDCDEETINEIMNMSFNELIKFIDDE